MKPKFYSTISVLGVLCLCFITNLQADTSNQLNKLIRLKSSVSTQSSKVDFLSFDKADKSIQLYIKRYTQNGKRETQTLLGRAAYYFPIFEFSLQEKELPEALKYLPVVESNLRKTVASPRGAVGLWQFMPATARHYGLIVNEHIDERLDPYKSSEAAATMLADLHQQFDDWFLALAAYNCGPGRVKKAIRKAGTRDFAAVKRFLPKQTRCYTDKLVAAIYVGQHYQEYQLQPKQIEQFNESILEEIKAEGAYSIEALVKEAKISLAQFHLLNPSYQQELLPAKQAYTLVLPKYTIEQVRNYMVSNPPQVQEPIIPEADINYLCLTHLANNILLDCTIPSNRHPQPKNQDQLQLNNWAVLRKTGLV